MKVKAHVLFALIVYLAIVALGCVLLWVAYEVGFRKRYTWIRESGKPVPLDRAVETAKPFAALAAISGVTVIAFAIAIPIAQIRFGTWQAYLLVIASVAAVANHIMVWRYRRRRALAGHSSNSTEAQAERQS